MVAKTVRQRVLDHLRRRKSATALQLADALQISAAGVRYHLGILVRDGRVTEDKVARKPRKGRPEKVYRVSEHLLGENLGVLADAVLDCWLEHVSEADRRAQILRVATALSLRIGTVDVQQPPAKRLVQLVQALSAMNYEAGWEAGAQGPRLLLGHCPYAAIIERHPELCAMDTELLGLQMGTQVSQIQKIERTPGGANRCVFVVGLPRPANSGDG